MLGGLTVDLEKYNSKHFIVSRALPISQYFKQEDV